MKLLRYQIRPPFGETLHKVDVDAWKQHWYKIARERDNFQRVIIEDVLESVEN